MGHPIQTLEAEDARLLLESSPEVPFPFQYFYMNMVLLYSVMHTRTHACTHACTHAHFGNSSDTAAE